jgi:O-antigen ligase
VWSESPTLAAFRVIQVATVAVLLAIIAKNLSQASVVWTILAILTAITVVNYFVAILYPSLGIHNYGIPRATGYQWRGILADKNYAGAASALAIIYALFAPVRLPAIARAAIALGALGFLVQTWSRTAIILCGVSVLAGAGIRLASHTSLANIATGRARRLLAVFALSFFGLIVATLLLIAFDVDAALAMLEDPNALSHRMQIWRVLVSTYAQSPFTGVGFGSFWTPNGAVSAEQGVGWMRNVNQGHNGYLDLLTQVGLPGLALALLALVLVPMRTLSRNLQFDREAVALIAAVIVFCVGSNLSESGLLTRDVIWSTFWLLAASMAAALDHRRRSADTDELHSGRSGERRRRRHRRPSAIGTARIRPDDE